MCVSYLASVGLVAQDHALSCMRIQVIARLCCDWQGVSTQPQPHPIEPAAPTTPRTPHQRQQATPIPSPSRPHYIRILRRRASHGPDRPTARIDPGPTERSALARKTVTRPDWALGPAHYHREGAHPCSCRAAVCGPARAAEISRHGFLAMGCRAGQWRAWAGQRDIAKRPASLASLALAAYRPRFSDFARLSIPPQLPGYSPAFLGRNSAPLRGECGARAADLVPAARGRAEGKRGGHFDRRKTLALARRFGTAAGRLLPRSKKGAENPKSRGVGAKSSAGRSQKSKDNMPRGRGRRGRRGFGRCLVARPRPASQ